MFMNSYISGKDRSPTDQFFSSDRPLNVQDLFVLMESYKNNIELSTMLLEQQKQLLSHQNIIIEKQKDQCDSLGKLLEKISNIIERQDKCATEVIKVQNELMNNQNNVKNEINKNQDTMRLEITKDHSGLKNLIYGVYTSIGLVIIALIGLLVTMFDKFHVLKDIAIKIGAGG